VGALEKPRRGVARKGGGGDARQPGEGGMLTGQYRTMQQWLSMCHCGIVVNVLASRSALARSRALQA
jgi:hypothetical protein